MHDGRPRPVARTPRKDRASQPVPAGVGAQDRKQVHGGPPRILIASRIDARGNLIVSALETRQKKVTREVVEKGRKVTLEGTLTYPVTVLDRQIVSLAGVAIYDRDG